MFSTFSGHFATEGWAPERENQHHQTPALQMSHTRAKSLGSLCSGFWSETCCKQGIDFCNHCLEFLCFIYSWQLLTIWHHQTVLLLLLLHSTFKLFVDLVAGPCFSRSCPKISGIVVSSAASILHSITNLKAVRKKEIRKKGKESIKKHLYIGILYWQLGNWPQEWAFKL